MRIQLFLFFSGSIILLGGCNKKAPPPQAPPPSPVTVAKPIPYDVQSYYEYNGYLSAVETVEVRARVKGYLNEVHFAEGDEVKAGDRLYTIDPREYAATVAKSKADIAKAEADMANARAQIKLAEADYERMVKLTDAASKSELDKAVATLAANRAQLDVAAANKAAGEAGLQTAILELGYTDIRSPISGRISRTLVTRGNLVGQSEATLLTTIVSMDPLYVYFDAPEKDLVENQKLQVEQPQQKKESQFPVEIGVATEDGYPHRGIIDFRDNRVDTGTGTVRIRGRIPNPAVGNQNARVLLPGLFARVRVPNGGPKSKLVIPEDALMTGQEGRYVFVVSKDNVVTKRTVFVGPAVWRADLMASPGSPSWILNNTTPAPPPAEGDAKKPTPTSLPIRSVISIEKGLEPGDMVIVNGLQKARPGAPVAPELWAISAPAKSK